MDKVNVVILAGDRKGSHPIMGDNKAFLPVNGVPCLVRVLRAFEGATRVGDIVVVGPSERLTVEFARYRILPDPRIRVVEQRENLIENGKAGFVASLEGVDDKTSFRDLDRSVYRESAVLATSCDIPLITPGEIDEFIRKSDMDTRDYCIGLCAEDVLGYYYPKEGCPGMHQEYFHLRDGNYRINNLNLIKPLKIAHLGLIEYMYEIRSQTHFLNNFKLLAIMLIKGHGVFNAIFRALRMVLAMHFYDRGFMRIYRVLKNSQKLGMIMDSIGRLLGADVSSVITSYGGAALDVDKPADLKVIEEMYDHWMGHQKGITPEA